MKFPATDHLQEQHDDFVRCAAQLKAALISYEFTADGVREFLGENAYKALYRGEPHAVLFSMRNSRTQPLAQLITVFLLHRALSEEDLTKIFGSELLHDLIRVGILGPKSANDSHVTALIDIHPHRVDGNDYFVFSDCDASQLSNYIPGKDHVLGVGAASLSLLSATSRSAVSSVLDLGTGSGIQVLGQLHAAESITATDIHPRALLFAHATLVDTAGLISDNRATVDIQRGSWFEPVRGRRFDRIIANPPFVVGPDDVSHIYRDSGLALDGATQLLMENIPDYLNMDGTATLLGSWIHESGHSFQQRLASWLPDKGVMCWILERDRVSPEHYCGTWLRDESIDPRSEQGAHKTLHWLDFFASHHVLAIGFGFVFIKRISDDLPSDILVEELTHPIEDLAQEAEEYFARISWLHAQTENEILQARYQVRPGIAQEEISVADAEEAMGFVPAARRITRMDGPRWSHDIDAELAAILAGLHPEGLNLSEVIELFAISRGLDPDLTQQAALPAVVDLIRHGFIIPADLLSGS
ncbi:class I SAM-dependent methyltransferase [Corynebacterium sp. ES2715-CONJ3]|uniref:N5-glutamine methyltransferase family protein n=1 Tax=Corynebacterium sp. ES2715-CONJ3 TaxID=2974028 RepID=UPI0021697B0C|nr:class I SAM-dependent methyltransferase [Corynebacterium sp. ES2715-CONJ3]MCS4491003.1 class I SAM-dependent methyltransferase [Corynebacterium sp. ES2715-CONJ3]